MPRLRNASRAPRIQPFCSQNCVNKIGRNEQFYSQVIHSGFTRDMPDVMVRRETTPVRPLIELLPIPGGVVFSDSLSTCDAHPLVRRLR